MLNSFNWKYRISISCFIDRYWSRIQDVQECPFRVFWKILILYSRYLWIYRTSFQAITHLFHSCPNVRCSRLWDFTKQYVRKWFGVFLYFSSMLVSPKLKRIGFGAHGHVQKFEHQENEGPKWNRKATRPKWSRIIHRAFL